MIKFRVWHKELKGHYKVESIIFNCDGSVKGVWVFKNDDVGHLFFNIEYTILEQYTGLQDNNGVDIYVGDIVYYERDEENFEIGYDDTIGAISICNGDVCYTFDNLYGTELEVIGNINENKELLENE